MPDTIKMQVTITFTYEANPEHYGEANKPLQMAGIDQTNFQDDPDHMVEVMGSAEDIKNIVQTHQFDLPSLQDAPGSKIYPRTLP